MAWRLALTCCVVACSSDAVCVINARPRGRRDFRHREQRADRNRGAYDDNRGTRSASEYISGSEALSPAACSHGSGAVDVCTIYEEPGDFRVTLSAPGYQPNVLSFTATSKNVACCANLPVAQTLSVVMQPTSE